MKDLLGFLVLPIAMFMVVICLMFLQVKVFVRSL